MRRRRSSARPGAGDSSITFWWRRCTEQSRSPRTTTCPVSSANTLHLDVTRVLEDLLDVELGVAERAAGLATRGLGAGQQLRLRVRPRACPSRRRPARPSGAAGSRVSFAMREQARLRRRARPRADRGRPGRPRLRDAALDGQLVAEDAASTSAGGPMKTRPASCARPREARVLGEEPVAGMDGVGAGRPRGGEEGVHAEIRGSAAAGPIETASSASSTWRRVGVGVAVDGDRGEPDLAERAEDPERDLAAVRDEHLLEGQARHRAGPHGGGRRARNAPVPARPSADARASAIASRARRWRSASVAAWRRSRVSALRAPRRRRARSGGPRRGPRPRPRRGAPRGRRGPRGRGAAPPRPRGPGP